MRYLFAPKVYRVLFVLAVLGTLFLTLSVPVKGSGLINDKLAHMITFFGLAMLNSHMWSGRYSWRSIFALCTLGLIIELIQFSLPWRSFSWFDWLADILGVLGYHTLHQLKVYWLIRRAKQDVQ
jgi:VanZ family protein